MILSILSMMFIVAPFMAVYWCCCGDGPPWCCDDSPPFQIDLHFHGIVNGSCSSCTGYNWIGAPTSSPAYTLTNWGSSCTWGLGSSVSASIGPCGFSGIFAFVFGQSLGQAPYQWQVQVYSSGGTLDALLRGSASSSLNCCASDVVSDLGVGADVTCGWSAATADVIPSSFC